MSFSFTNPDVDPLSLNERVRKLESRLGPGGSGGGSFAGSIPDFDQYPDNAIKVTNEGMIVKLSVDDIGANIGLAEAGGVGFKFCGFLPYWGGVLGAPCFIAARCYYKNNLGGLPGSTSKNAGKVIPFDTADWVDHLHVLGGNGGGIVSIKFNLGGKTLNSPLPTGTFDLTLGLSIQQNAAVPPILSRNEASVSFYAYSTIDTRRQIIEGNTYSFAAFWISDPWFVSNVSSGRILGQYTHSIGGFNSGTNFFVKNLQQVPPSAHQIYPASWLVP